MDFSLQPFQTTPLDPWITRRRTTIFDHSRFLRVEAHEVELPGGEIIPDWPWIVTPDYINVVAVAEEGEFLLFRQTKYGVPGTSLAPVGGYLEPGEEPLEAAQRELLEETGYEAREWEALGSFCVDGNRGAGTAHLFLACAAYRVAEPRADDLEVQQLLHLSRAQVEDALAAGEFKVLAWAANVALALLHLH